MIVTPIKTILTKGLEDKGVVSAWQQFMSTADLPTHYSSPAFFCEPRFRGRNPFAILALDGDTVVGVITGTAEGDRVCSGQGSSPQIAIARGANRDKILKSLIEGVGAEFPRAALTKICSWEEESSFTCCGYSRRDESGVVMIDLAPDLAKLYSGLSQRYNINKAIKSGVEVAEGTTDDFVGYYQLYAEWSKRKGFHVTPPVEFMELFALTDNRRLFVARYHGEIIAGSVVRFQHGGMLEYAANSSREDLQHLRANDLLQWRIIEWGKNHGFCCYSMGGTQFFHQKFGGTIKPTYSYQLDRTFLQRHERKEQLKTSVRKILSKLPESVKVRIKGLGH
ncbi:MAG: GNAT family N-acetyltransferase [Geobacteraceae bacterium]|nr:GNAT family N-acetyltransferase [Geobacteraceae bacterium]